MSIAAPPHSFIYRNHRRQRHIGWDNDGGAILAYENDTVETFTIIPALPGWTMIAYSIDAPEEDDPNNADWRLTSIPIIAWRISRTSTLDSTGHEYCLDWTSAITPDSNEDTGDYLSADGHVYGVSYCGLPFSEWLEEKRKRIKPV